MADSALATSVVRPEEWHPPSSFREFVRHFVANRSALVAALILMALVVAALGADILVPQSPIEQHRDAMLTPPAWMDGGSSEFLLGTDDLGRDMVARLVHGARLSLAIGAVSVVLAVIPGVALGLLAAFFPRVLGVVIMRTVDVLLSLPALLLAIAVVAVLGPGLGNTMYAIAIVLFPGFVRLARAVALGEVHREYVVASRLAGANTPRLMFNTVLPNCMAPVLVQMALGFSEAILDAAALGFLGLGAQPPYPEWGAMLASARDHIGSASWVVTMPGLAILVTVIAINLVGDGLRDALDPRLKQME